MIITHNNDVNLLPNRLGFNPSTRNASAAFYQPSSTQHVISVLANITPNKCYQVGSQLALLHNNLAGCSISYNLGCWSFTCLQYNYMALLIYLRHIKSVWKLLKRFTVSYQMRLKTFLH